jgi:hypothetical protein
MQSKIHRKYTRETPNRKKKKSNKVMKAINMKVGTGNCPVLKGIKEKSL